MLVLAGSRLKKSYGDREILRVDSLMIYEADRIGVVGINGSGKTTLLRILAGDIDADEGKVERKGEGFFIRQLEDSESKVEESLLGRLGVKEIEKETMSGGERTRLKIAEAFSSQASILFADEPTSSLDMAGIDFLEEELKNFKGAIVIVSHDRMLLDNVCNRILEVEGGRVGEYPGNYSDYKRLKEMELKRKSFEYEQYEKEKNRLEKAIYHTKERVQEMKKAPKRMGNSEARLHKGKASQKKARVDRVADTLEARIERLEKKEKPRKEDMVQFDLYTNEEVSAKVVIKGQSVTLGFGSRVLLDDVCFEVPKAKRVALLGGNGTGKTSLMNLIYAGSHGIKIAPRVKLGYFKQGLEDLEEDKSVLENVMRGSIYSESMVRTVLARLLFRRDDVYKKVKVLSGGERVKLSLARLCVGDFNVLMLDEPTNYLDIASREALEEVLGSYPGTILFASHDRSFVEALAERLLIIEGSKLQVFAGGYSEYVRRGSLIDNEMMVLEHRLAEVVSRLSIAIRVEEKEELEREYKEILMLKKGLE